MNSLEALKAKSLGKSKKETSYVMPDKEGELLPRKVSFYLRASEQKIIDEMAKRVPRSVTASTLCRMGLAAISRMSASELAEYIRSDEAADRKRRNR
jgi:hypothetical protein